MVLVLSNDLGILISLEELESLCPTLESIFFRIFSKLGSRERMIFSSRPDSRFAGNSQIVLDYLGGADSYALSKGTLSSIFLRESSELFYGVDLRGLTVLVTNLRLEQNSALLVSKNGNNITLSVIPLAHIQNGSS